MDIVWVAELKDGPAGAMHGGVAPAGLGMAPPGDRGLFANRLDELLNDCRDIIPGNGKRMRRGAVVVKGVFYDSGHGLFNLFACNAQVLEAGRETQAHSKSLDGRNERGG